MSPLPTRDLRSPTPGQLPIHCPVNVSGAVPVEVPVKAPSRGDPQQRSHTHQIHLKALDGVTNLKDCVTLWDRCSAIADSPDLI